MWRTLEELNAPVSAPAKQALPAWEELDRRGFLKFMGASAALGGMTACTRQPLERIVPYVTPPEDGIVGKPLFFASTYTRGGYGQGVLVESHQGRPTKIEGNPAHAASLGGTDIFAQASVLDLYDPDRSQSARKNGKLSTWQAYLAELAGTLAGQGIKQGAGIRIVTGSSSSPTLQRQMKQLTEAYPKATWHQVDGIPRDNVRLGAELAFGRVVDPIYNFTQADVVVSLDADFLLAVPAFARYARDFASRRDPGRNFDGMNRLYVVESAPTVTGTAADHRRPLRASEVEGFARALARAVGLDVEAPYTPEGFEDFIEAIAGDLKEHARHGLVIAGDQQPPAVHALAHAINDTLKNTGKTVRYIKPVIEGPADQTASLAELTQAMAAGEVDVLILSGVNPAFTAPADLAFTEHLQQVPFSAHHGLYTDETANQCRWHIPAAHYLEAWSDARAFDGQTSLVQPLIEPMYGGKSVHELVGALIGAAGVPGYDLVRETWQAVGMGNDFEAGWRRALHDGVIEGTAARNTRVTCKPTFGEPAAPVAGIEIILRPDPSIDDGQFANNAWLQELPRPVTKLTWDNAAIMSPATARTLKVKHKLDDASVVTLEKDDLKMKVPVLILPGHADESITLHLGYGRKFGGRVHGNIDEPVGVDAYPLRSTGALALVSGVTVKKDKKGSAKLATTQHHPTVQESLSVKDRGHFRVGDVADYETHFEHPAFVHGKVHTPRDDETVLHSPVSYDKGNKWGMVIDLNACIGCNACTIACQAENNIAVVGKREVLKGRELHWIRIDRWWEGTEENPSTYHMPVACVQCENAPCEIVCPVGATVHSAEGLNQMIYNRCVGTRYCSNNCPYKVRRFNFFKYADHDTEQTKMVRNPDVTVRYRGVMEKCTFCVQRINGARIEAKVDNNRPIADGEVVTACQQVCPVGAIAFGNLNDPDSVVAEQAASPLGYGLLAELNTRPRTTYLAKLNNPHPLLAAASGSDHSTPAAAPHQGEHH